MRADNQIMKTLALGTGILLLCACGRGPCTMQTIVTSTGGNEVTALELDGGHVYSFSPFLYGRYTTGTRVELCDVLFADRRFASLLCAQPRA